MPLTEGENYVSFDALNLWASKRGFEINWNRIETKNSCVSNLWRQEFVIYNAAAAGSGHSLPIGALSLLPSSRQVALPPSSSEEGRGYDCFLAPPDGGAGIA